ncbi:MAG: cofactor-independent phosphoglycerate mutase [Candidatus Brockarchaeota archaeon]|nr:cofactor-independent phosphoglycerate mutase [Candidatus Brockarchaeota archaeon]
MKYLVIVGDGMADYPVEEVNGKTPLQVAEKPNMDEIARRGRMGMLRTLRPSLPRGSDVANLIMLGYDPCSCYTGRGPLEAAARGIRAGDDEVVFRCNLITVEENRVADYSGGHITTSEAEVLISELNKRFSSIGRFYTGVSYRNIFVSKRGQGLKATPPHDIVGEEYGKHLLKPDNEDSRLLNRMMVESISVLSENQVNIRRQNKGEKPANMAWIWGQGRMPNLEPFALKHGLRGAVIAAVDLIKGIGRLAQMHVPDVPGATGYYDTSYENKAVYAVKALEESDFVYLHVESPDEAGHEGSFETKVKVIEEMDKRLFRKILDSVEENVSISILVDHPTPVSVRNHTLDPTPFAVMKPGLNGDGLPFDEDSGLRGSFGLVDGMEIVKLIKRV